MIPADYLPISHIIITHSLATLLVTTLVKMAQCLRSLLDFTRYDTKRSSHGANAGSSLSVLFCCGCMLTFVFSCLAHVINLGTQVLISMYIQQGSALHASKSSGP
jgi:hypothetical protein